jgi:cytochrome c551/c552
VKKAASYALRSYIYKYQHQYGSPIIELKDLKIAAIDVSADKRKVRLVIDGLRQYYIHEFKLEGIRNESGDPLLHETAYYTLNQIPSGARLTVSDANKMQAEKVEKVTPVVATKSKSKSIISDAEAMALLKKHTCLACHAKEAKVVGPSYVDIAKRNYTDKQILALVYKPNPQNWPDYATEMAPMSHVPAGDVLKIASWINGLKNKALLNRD